MTCVANALQTGPWDAVPVRRYGPYPLTFVLYVPPPYNYQPCSLSLSLSCSISQVIKHTETPLSSCQAHINSFSHAYSSLLLYLHLSLSISVCVRECVFLPPSVSFSVHLLLRASAPVDECVGRGAERVEQGGELAPCQSHCSAPCKSQIRQGQMAREEGVGKKKKKT